MASPWDVFNDPRINTKNPSFQPQQEKPILIDYLDRQLNTPMRLVNTQSMMEQPQQQIQQQRKGPGLLHYIAMLDPAYNQQFRQMQFIRQQENEKQRQLNLIKQQQQQDMMQRNQRMMGAFQENYGTDDPVLNMLVQQAMGTGDWNKLTDHLVEGRQTQTESIFDNQKAMRSNEFQFELENLKSQNRMREQRAKGEQTAQNQQDLARLQAELGLNKGVNVNIGGTVDEQGNFIPGGKGAQEAQETAGREAGAAISDVAALEQSKAATMDIMNDLIISHNQGEKITSWRNAYHHTPYFGDMLLNTFAPDAYELKGNVIQAVAPVLKAILGSQFSAKEGENLMNSVFDAGITVNGNIKRLSRFMAGLDATLQVKKNLIRSYFGKGVNIELLTGDYENKLQELRGKLSPVLGAEMDSKLLEIDVANTRLLQGLANGTVDLDDVYQNMIDSDVPRTELKKFYDNFINVDERVDAEEKEVADMTNTVSQFDLNIDTLMNSDIEPQEKQNKLREEYNRVFDLLSQTTNENDIVQLENTLDNLGNLMENNFVDNPSIKFNESQQMEFKTPTQEEIDNVINNDRLTYMNKVNKLAKEGEQIEMQLYRLQSEDYSRGVTNEPSENKSLIESLMDKLKQIRNFIGNNVSIKGPSFEPSDELRNF